VQTFWQENLKKILQSYPKQNTKLLIISDLYFLSTEKVFQKEKLLITGGYT
jgi:hypothetical protein